MPFMKMTDPVLISVGRRNARKPLQEDSQVPPVQLTKPFYWERAYGCYKGNTMIDSMKPTWPFTEYSRAGKPFKTHMQLFSAECPV